MTNAGLPKSVQLNMFFSLEKKLLNLRFNKYNYRWVMKSSSLLLNYLAYLVTCFLTISNVYWTSKVSDYEWFFKYKPMTT